MSYILCSSWVSSRIGLISLEIFCLCERESFPLSAVGFRFAGYVGVYIPGDDGSEQKCFLSLRTASPTRGAKYNQLARLEVKIRRRQPAYKPARCPGKILEKRARRGPRAVVLRCMSRISKVVGLV